MIRSMCSSVTELCQVASWKLRGLGLRLAEAGPSPLPVGPWQGVHRSEKICVASVRASAVMVAAPLAAGAASAARSAVLTTEDGRHGEGENRNDVSRRNLHHESFPRVDRSVARKA
jgi:hypothetical protein